MASKHTTKKQLLQLYRSLLTSVSTIDVEPEHSIVVEMRFTNNHKCTILVIWHTGLDNSFKIMYDFYSYEENKSFLDRIVKTIYICNFEEFKNLKYEVKL